MNASDYKKKRLNLFNLLPDPYRSEINESVYENLFNRFFTKPETETVIGYIGKGNSAIANQQIQEPTPNRQAFQLQPLAYSKIGTVEHISSAVDFLNEWEAVGVDRDTFNTWGSTTTFNWVPPIDLDKLIHFSDYFWRISPGKQDAPPSFQTPGPFRDTPQYITIKDPCFVGQLTIAKYQQTINNFTSGGNGLIPLISTNETANTIIVAGNLTPVFSTGFSVYIDNSSTSALNNTFFLVSSSSYDITTNQTTIIIDASTPIPANGTDGDIDLTLYMSVLVAQQQVLCSGGAVGFDLQQFDDSQIGNIIWTTGLLASISSATQPGTPNGMTCGPGSNESCIGQIWYDTTNNILKQSNGTSWVSVINNFSVLVAQATGGYPFDYLNCGTGSCVTLNNWQLQNRWVHRSSVAAGDQVIQAKMPIIEFLPFLELNSWSNVVQEWVYRTNGTIPFSSSTAQPTLFELAEVTGSLYTIASSTNVVFDQTLGNMSASFVKGFKFNIVGSSVNNGTYTVTSSSYTLSAGPRRQMSVEFTPALSSTTPVTAGSITPTVTSQGDTWQGYNVHWSYVGIADIRAVPAQQVNDLLAIDPTSAVVNVPSRGYTYQVSPYAQQIVITDVPTFVSTGVVAFDSSLTHLVKGGLNAVRIYYLQQTGDQLLDRQYDDIFTENVDVSNNVTGITFDTTFTVGIGVGDVILINVGEDALSDVGTISLAVRDNADDSVFSATLGNDVVTPTQTGPITHNLVAYIRSEQVKSQVQQYPLFDLYNVDLTPAYLALPLFQFQELSTQPVNTTIGRRIVVTSTINGIVYSFQQNLLSEDNGPLYVYKDAGIQRISETLSPFTTIWRSGIPPTTYTPQYVDKNDNPVAIGASIGEWALPDQMFYNPEHLNQQIVTSANLLGHFQSIVDGQPPVPGITGATRSNFELMLTPNYGIGGTIREHNYSFDTSISSLFINTVTVPELIQFARDQYEGLLNEIRTLFFKNVLPVMTSLTPATLVDPGAALTSLVVSLFEENDFYGVIYGDSTTYNQTTKIGILNWIATLPYLRLVHKVVPQLNEDTLIGAVGSSTSLISLLHHDGHRSKLEFPSGLQNQLVADIVATPDSRSTLGTLGATLRRQFTSQPALTTPNTTSAFMTLFGTSSVLPGVYVYLIDNSNQTQQLYRLQIIAASSTNPSTDFVNGTMYYNTATNLVKVLSGGVWVNSTGIPNDLSTAWVRVDTQFPYYLGNALLTVENGLYAAAPTYSTPSYDLSPIPAQSGFQQLIGTYYLDYAKNIDLANTLINASFNQSDPFTWNYSFAFQTVTLPNGQTTNMPIGGWWEYIYNQLFTTPYPHLEPWRLQGYISKPTWWDAQFADPSHTRRWSTAMWTDYILVGSIPQGQLYPSGAEAVIYTAAGDPSHTGTDHQTLPTYQWLPINVGADAIQAVNSQVIYTSDELLPPYVSSLIDVITTVAPPSYIQALYSLVPDGYNVLTNTTLLPGEQQTDYLLGTQYLYDINTIAYRENPIQYVNYTFGEQFTTINNLLVDTMFDKVFSHRDTVFHGDIYKGQPFQVNGLNQWYVNYNRYSGFDTGGSDFYDLWKNWTPTLAYQFGRFIDGNYLTIQNRNFNIVPDDYNVTIKKTPALYNKQQDSLVTQLLAVPYPLISQPTIDRWRIGVSSQNPNSASITYNLPNLYQFEFDPATSTYYIYRNTVVNVLNLSTVIINGNQLEQYGTGQAVTIANSLTNNGSYTVASATYNFSANQTTVILTTPLATTTVDGSLNSSFRRLPDGWATGTEVYLTSTDYLPSPLITNNRYNLIYVSSSSFKLAYSSQSALAGVPIPVTQIGSGTSKVGQLINSFIALNGAASSSAIWQHFTTDQLHPVTIVDGTEFNTIQDFISFVDGFADYANQQGFIFNLDLSETDQQTGRIVGWQLEEERFIDWAYLNQGQIYGRTELYPVSASGNTFTFGNQIPSWVTGTKIAFDVAPGGVLPNIPVAGGPSEPIIIGQIFYIVRTGPMTFGIAQSLGDAKIGNIIPLASTGSGTFYIRNPLINVSQPTFELNPFRYNLWIRHDLGVLSNVIQGPYQDITEQTIFDQYGEKIAKDNLLVYRQDRLSELNHTAGVIPGQYTSSSQYTDIHFASMHVFFDGYEQVVLFSDYTAGGNLMYDPFLGLTVDRLALNFEGQNAQITLDSSTKRYAKVADFTYNVLPIGTPRDPIVINSIEISDQDLVLFAALSANASIYRYNITSGIFTATEAVEILGDVVVIYEGTYQKDTFIYNGAQWISSKYTLRPNVGGYYLSGNTIQKNFENQTQLGRYMYDTYYPNENEPLTQYARALLGYTQNPDDFLIGLGLDDKTKFLFWKGMIHNKGTINSITALTNNSMFVDANVDEYWAFKLANFGSGRRYKFPELKLFIQDGLSNSFRVDFLEPQEAQSVYSINNKFTPVYLSDTSRWVDQPDQAALLQNEQTMYFDAKLKLLEITTDDLIVNNGNTFINPALIPPNDDIVFTLYDEIDSKTVIITKASTPTLSGTFSVFVHNRTTIQLLIPVGFQPSDYLPLKLYIVTPDKEKHNPFEVIDLTANVTVTDVIVWDPIHGYNDPNANRNVDLIFGNNSSLLFDSGSIIPEAGWDSAYDDSDGFDPEDGNSSMYQTLSGAAISAPPARYLVDPAQYSQAASESLFYFNTTNSSSPWGQNKVGTVWWDTSVLGYRPYYDDLIYREDAPNLAVAKHNFQNRMNDWGVLADWAQMNVYQWTASAITPDAWNAAVAANDPTSPVQYSGSVKQVLLKNVTTSGSPVWILEADEHKLLYNAIEQFNNTTLPVAVSFSQSGELVNIYVNEIFQIQVTVDVNGNVSIPVASTTFPTLTNRDIVRFVRPAAVPTAAQITAGVYQYVTPYTTVPVIHPDGSTTNTYYFWVQNPTTLSDDLAVSLIPQYLTTPQYPYVIFENVSEENFSAFQIPYLSSPWDEFPWDLDQNWDTNSTVDLVPNNPGDTLIGNPPTRYTRMIIKMLNGIISQENRYSLRMTIDETLRDSLAFGRSSLDLKAHHTEWTIQRINQGTNIPRNLWDNITQAIIGYQLNNPAAVIPSLQRQVYDAQYGTSTSYGLGVGQAFTSGTLAVSTIKAFLLDPNNTFPNTNVQQFLQMYDFTIASDVITAMDLIYSTFGSVNVNGIFFSVLQDALTLNLKYKDIFKTSLVALHAVNELQTAGELSV